MLYSLEKEHFGQYIRHVRESLNLTQQEVSYLTTLSCETLRRIEKGENLPTLRTIENLTMAYKVDVIRLYMTARKENALHSFYEYLDNLIISYEHETLKNISSIFDAFFIQTEQIHNKKEVDQFMTIIQGLELSYTTHGSIEALNTYIEAIRLTITNFCLTDIQTFKYSYLELKCLFLVSSELNMLKRFKESNQIALFLLERYSFPVDLFSNTAILKIKLLMNIAYNYHCLDQHQLAFEYATLGIEYCKKNKTNYLLHGLYYRRGIASILGGFGEKSGFTDLRKSIMLLDVNDMVELKTQYINVTKEKYGISL